MSGNKYGISTLNESISESPRKIVDKMRSPCKFSKIDTEKIEWIKGKIDEDPSGVIIVFITMYQIELAPVQKHTFIVPTVFVLDSENDD